MSAPDGKRRLPLAPRAEVAEPKDEQRPPWHWSAIGVVGIFVFWLPLAMVVNAALGARTGALGAALNAAAFALASFGAGYSIGRFGGAAGRREAAVAGAAAALVATAIAAWGAAKLGDLLAALLLVLAVMAPLGAGAAWAGGALGVRGRR